MMLRFLTIAFVLATSSVAFGQTDISAAPKTMFGFLKPGMRVGVSSVQGTASVILSTYTEDDYTVAQDLKDQLGVSLMSAASVAETNASVRVKLQEYVSRLNPVDDSKSRIMIMPLFGTSFGTVTAVGDDYVLLNLGGEHTRKRIIPKASISTIYLDANPVRFVDPNARSSSGRSE